MDNVNSNLVYPVVIVSVFGEVSFYFVVNYDAVFITNGFYFGIFDGRQGVCNNRQAGNTGCKPAGYLMIVKSHLQTLVAVFVMHIVDDVQAVYINTGQPLHHIVVAIHNLIVIQILRGNRTVFRSYLLFADLIYTAVDCVQKTFGQVGTGSEELHFFSDPHGGYAAGNRIIIAVGNTHQVIIFILDGG